MRLLFALYVFGTMQIFARSLRTKLTSASRASRLPLSSVTANYIESDRISANIAASTNLLFDGDVLVIPFYKPKAGEDGKDPQALAAKLKSAIPESLSKDIRDVLADIFDEGIFKADSNSKQLTRLVGSTTKYIALVGLGFDKKKTESNDIEVATASKLGKSVASIIKDTKAKNIGLVLPSGMGNAGITQFFLGLQDATYVDNRYRKSPEEGTKGSSLSSVKFLGCTESIARDIELTYKLTDMIGSGVNFAKDLVGAPPNSKTPEVIADLARQMAKDLNLECTVLGEKECKELGMGGYLGVQQGSMFPPQFIHLTYKPAKLAPNGLKVALIGKGLTFDSGGYNLKAGPGSMIELMKFDMGGCAAVLGCAKAIGQLRPNNVEVHWITAVCENMISAQAMRPGDILTASNGKTIEVLNTDAEGRLTLADALVYADKLDVDVIIDLATLTGACIVALGEKLAGVYSPDKELLDDLASAAARADEGLWPLPLEASYKELIKSSIADLKNIGGKGGGSITAALFLQEFVEKAKWAHIDMAGPVWDSTNSKPTGYGVKLLVDYLLNARKK